MRQIEKGMVMAFNNDRNWQLSNTRVAIIGDTTCVFLHGNCIAQKENGKVRFSDAGWPTVTTCSRLRALGCDVHIKNGETIFADDVELF